MGFRVFAAVATAALPVHGTLVPGTTLGGLRLGIPAAKVLRLWGRQHGTCRNCTRPTWYYNYFPYEPQGAGVELAGGRVAAIFTLWSPSGWHTSHGLRIGDPAKRVTSRYGRLPVERCTNYDAYALVRARSVTVFYVADGKLWGFGLNLPSVPVCR